MASFGMASHLEWVLNWCDQPGQHRVAQSEEKELSTVKACAVLRRRTALRHRSFTRERAVAAQSVVIPDKLTATSPCMASKSRLLKV